MVENITIPEVPGQINFKTQLNHLVNDILSVNLIKRYLDVTRDEPTFPKIPIQFDNYK